MDDAKLLLIDEPSLGLAPKISKGLLQALMQIDLKDGAMVIAEQNLSLLEGRVSRLIALHAGKLKGGAVTPDLPTSEFIHHGGHSIRSIDAAARRRPPHGPLLLVADRGESRVDLRVAAIGISIIWSSLGMINLAQGFTFTVAGYGAWLAAQNISTNGFVVVAAGVMTGALAGR